MLRGVLYVRSLIFVRLVGSKSNAVSLLACLRTNLFVTTPVTLFPFFLTLLSIVAGWFLSQC